MAVHTILVGSIGRGNLGDEAMLLAALSRYGREQSLIISANPLATSATYHCESIGRFEWRRIWWALKNNSTLVFIGGSLLQSATSVRSLFYYVALMRLAKLAGATILLEGQGWGPFHQAWAEGLAVYSLRWAKLVELRDPVAYERLKVLGPTIRLGLDPAFRMPVRVMPYKTLKRSVAMILRPHRSFSDQGQKVFLDFCVAIMERWHKKLVFLPLALPEDLALSQYFVEQLKGEGRSIELIVARDVDHAAQVLASMELVFSMRYHGCVFAEWLQRKYIGLSYDPKVAHHCRLYRRPFLNMQSLSLNELHYLWGQMQLEVEEPVL